MKTRELKLSTPKGSLTALVEALVLTVLVYSLWWGAGFVKVTVIAVSKHYGWQK